MDKKQVTAVVEAIVTEILAKANEGREAAEQIEESEARTLFGMLLRRNRASFVTAATTTANAAVVVAS